MARPRFGCGCADTRRSIDTTFAGARYLVNARRERARGRLGRLGSATHTPARTLVHVSAVCCCAALPLVCGARGQLLIKHSLPTLSRLFRVPNSRRGCVCRSAKKRHLASPVLTCSLQAARSLLARRQPTQTPAALPSLSSSPRSPEPVRGLSARVSVRFGRWHKKPCAASDRRRRRAATKTERALRSIRLACAMWREVGRGLREREACLTDLTARARCRAALARSPSPAAPSRRPAPPDLGVL